MPIARLLRCHSRVLATEKPSSPSRGFLWRNALLPMCIAYLICWLADITPNVLFLSKLMKICLQKRELYIFQHKESRQQAYVSSYINIVVINNRFTRITRAPFFGFRYGCGFSLFSSRQFCDLPSDEFSVHVDRYSEDNPLLDFIPERQKTMIKTELSNHLL